MKFYINHSIRSSYRSGFTLVELMVTMALAGLLMSSLVALGMFTSKSFYMMANYEDLDKQSRHTVDLLSREIRNASALVSFSTNSPASLQFTNATGGYGVTVTYYTNNGTLMFAKTGQATQMLLTNCDNWSFALYDRYPNITSNSVSFYSATNSAGQLDSTVCKVINLSWKCSRKIFGSKINTESVQTAQIALRNKMTN